MIGEFNGHGYFLKGQAVYQHRDLLVNLCDILTILQLSYQHS